MKKILLLCFVLGLLLAAVSAYASDQPFEWSWKLADDRLEIVLSSPKDAYVYENMTEVKVEHAGNTLPAEKMPRSVEKEAGMRSREKRGRSCLLSACRSCKRISKSDPLFRDFIWKTCGLPEKGIRAGGFIRSGLPN